MITLKYFDSNDFTQLIAWIKDEETLMNWSGGLFSFPLKHTSLDWYIEDVNDISKSEAFVYKAIDEETGKTVGHISLGGISKKNKAGRITRVLVDPIHQGKGYCRQMVSAVLKIGFEELKLHRICLGVYDFNKAAISCYKNAGLVIEGTNRDCLLFKGQWWSLVEMSILEEEWKDEAH
jgi:RimJ/RimL family protein N-acetyltransferase